MKTTLNYVNVDYSVNGSTIVCNLVAELDIWRVKNMSSFFEIYDVRSYIKRFTDKHGRVLIHTTGRATCSPEDVFDEVLGKHIAYTRAQEAAFWAAYDFYNEVERRAVLDLDNTINNCAMSSISCSKHYHTIAGIPEDNYDLDEEAYNSNVRGRKNRKSEKNDYDYDKQKDYEDYEIITNFDDYR